MKKALLLSKIVMKLVKFTVKSIIVFYGAVFFFTVLLCYMGRF